MASSSSAPKTKNQKKNHKKKEKSVTTDQKEKGVITDQKEKGVITDQKEKGVISEPKKVKIVSSTSSDKFRRTINNQIKLHLEDAQDEANIIIQGIKQKYKEEDAVLEASRQYDNLRNHLIDLLTHLTDSERNVIKVGPPIINALRNLRKDLTIDDVLEVIQEYMGILISKLMYVEKKMDDEYEDVDMEKEKGKEPYPESEAGTGITEMFRRVFDPDEDENARMNYILKLRKMDKSLLEKYIKKVEEDIISMSINDENRDKSLEILQKIKFGLKQEEKNENPNADKKGYILRSKLKELNEPVLPMKTYRFKTTTKIKM